MLHKYEWVRTAGQVENSHGSVSAIDAHLNICDKNLDLTRPWVVEKNYSECEARQI